MHSWAHTGLPQVYVPRAWTWNRHYWKVWTVNPWRCLRGDVVGANATVTLAFDAQCCTNLPLWISQLCPFYWTEFCSEAAAPVAPPFPPPELAEPLHRDDLCPHPLYQHVCPYWASHTSCSQRSTRLQRLKKFSSHPVTFCWIARGAGRQRRSSITATRRWILWHS